MTTHSEPSVNVILLLSSSHSRIWSLIVGGMMGVWKRTRKSKNNENNGLRPNVSFFVWKRIHTFCTGLAYCPQVSDENCHRKRIRSKTLSRETIFENTVLQYLCGYGGFWKRLHHSVGYQYEEASFEDGADGSVTIALGIALLSVWTSKNDQKNTARGHPFLTCFF